MRFEFKPSFARSLKGLPPKEQTKVKQTARKVIDFYTTGMKTPGLGIAHLRGSFWEVRSGLKERVLYRWEKDLVEFVLVGNHNDVRRFLKGAG